MFGPILIIIVASILLLVVFGFVLIFSIFKIFFGRKKLSTNQVYDDKDFDLETERKEIESLRDDYIQRLSQVGNIDEETVLAELTEEVKEKYSKNLESWKKKKLSRVISDSDREAVNIIGAVIQKNSSRVANDFTVIDVELQGEDEKSKLIGKDGRNIQYFESLTGVSMVIDNQSLIVSLSGYDAVRRFAAKKTIEKLLWDGKIHPGKIQEYWDKSCQEIDKEIVDQGQKAVKLLGINDFPEDLVKLIGRLYFRSSYGQNVLRHSIEVAKLAKSLAREVNERFPSFGVDEEICLKGGLLHDIGKAVDETQNWDHGHMYYGKEVIKKFGLSPLVLECVLGQSNYSNEKALSIEAMLVNASDSISAGRKGARKLEVEAIQQRLSKINKVVESFYGVSKCWVMKGGREIWVFFDTEKVNSYQLDEITSNIGKEIKNIDGFGGEIKIVGKWEDQFIVDLQ